MKSSTLVRLAALASIAPLFLVPEVQGQQPASALGSVRGQAVPFQRRSSDTLRSFRIRGGGEGVELDGWADHTVFVRHGPDGELETVCLQGDTHELAQRVLAPGGWIAPEIRAAPTDVARAARVGDVTGTMLVDPKRRAGADDRDRVLLYTPDPIVPGSSRSHFDRRATPNLLMEPNISPDLEFGEVDLTNEALRDMGWPNGRFTATVDYADGAGSGFNDPQLGQARRTALEYVANLWSRILGSTVGVNIQARFQQMECSEGGGVLAAAGPTFVFLNFPRGKNGVWYPGPMAEALARQDLSGQEAPDSPADLVIFFNSAIDTACLGEGTSYYYGLDGGASTSQIAFVTVALHEMGHGLGFTGLSNLNTGKLFQNKPDIFTTLMFDNETGESWDEMSKKERRQSAVRDGQVAFTGKRARRGARRMLDGSPVLRVDAPESLSGTYEVGTAAFGGVLDEAGLGGEFALVNDGSATPTLACQTLTNAAELAGRIAVIDRGTCRFDEKAQRAEQAGAIGVVVINNVAGAPSPMGGDPGLGVTIPLVMVDQELGERIKAELAS